MVLEDALMETYQIVGDIMTLMMKIMPVASIVREESFRLLSEKRQIIEITTTAALQARKKTAL